MRQHNLIQGCQTKSVRSGQKQRISPPRAAVYVRRPSQIERNVVRRCDQQTAGLLDEGILPGILRLVQRNGLHPGPAAAKGAGEPGAPGLQGHSDGSDESGGFFNQPPARPWPPNHGSRSSGSGESGGFSTYFILLPPQSK